MSGKPEFDDARTVSYENPDGGGWRGRKRWVAERQRYQWSGGEWGHHGWFGNVLAYGRTRSEALYSLQTQIDGMRAKSAKRAAAEKAKAVMEKEAKDRAQRIIDTSFEIHDPTPPQED